MSIFSRPFARTNNPLERFNRKLNSAFPTAHPSLPVFVATINRIASEYVEELSDVVAVAVLARRRQCEIVTLPRPVRLDGVLVDESSEDEECGEPENDEEDSDAISIKSEEEDVSDDGLSGESDNE